MREIISGSAALALVFTAIAFCIIGMDAWVNGASMARRDRIAGRLVGFVIVAVVWLIAAFYIGGDVP